MIPEENLQNVFGIFRYRMSGKVAIATSSSTPELGSIPSETICGILRVKEEIIEKILDERF